MSVAQCILSIDCLPDLLLTLGERMQQSFTAVGAARWERLHAQEAAGEELPGKQPLVEVGEVVREGGILRALPFDESQHALLCEELKHLYTAITRAKNNGELGLLIAVRWCRRVVRCAAGLIKNFGSRRHPHIGYSRHFTCKPAFLT